MLNKKRRLNKIKCKSIHKRSLKFIIECWTTLMPKIRIPTVFFCSGTPNPFRNLIFVLIFHFPYMWSWPYLAAFYIQIPLSLYPCLHNITKTHFACLLSSPKGILFMYFWTNLTIISFALIQCTFQYIAYGGCFVAPLSDSDVLNLWVY